MLLLLGDQLIRDAGLAAFELVKNAYDADATRCVVTIHDVESETGASISIEDDGFGMDHEIILNVWLEPGTDYRAEQKNTGMRSPRFKRLPLGEKGIGRFAVHKLGRIIELISRRKGEDEVVVKIDWAAFNSTKYLADVPVEVYKREPEHFIGKHHGTLIKVTKLWSVWTRARVRQLHRSITSICSPFDTPDNFQASLFLEPENNWFVGLLDAKTVLREALYHAKGTIQGGKLEFDYEFTPLPQMEGKIKGRTDTCSAEMMAIEGKKPRKLNLDDLPDYQSIGAVGFEFRIFDLETRVLELANTEKASLKEYLKSNGGIRVYRDGVRVFDMGEPGNDWLDLDSRRVNTPTVKIGNNQIIGAIHLIGGASLGLVEKTNREGFVENEAYSKFRAAVIFALSQVEATRWSDKDRLRKIYSRKTQKEPVIAELTELRQEVESRGLTKDLGQYLDRIEFQFHEVRDRLLTAAGPGLTLTVVIHEVEKIIGELSEALKHGVGLTKITALVKHLSDVVDGLTFLVRKEGTGKEKASELIRQALFNTEFRLRAHGVKVINGLEHGGRDFTVRCVRRLIISTLMNILDNSIYWLENKGASDRRIYLGTSFELDDKPALVVADNGPGFQDPSEYLVEPFFTRKPDGMGLGLHIANEIAKIHKGKLIFPEPGDISLPSQFTGAVIAFQFPKTL
jgi:signal transduction histidine kinase